MIHNGSIGSRDWLAALSCTPGIGRQTLNYLFPYLNHWPSDNQSLLTSLPSNLHLTPRMRKALQPVNLSYVQQLKQKLIQDQIFYITCYDDFFPIPLREIPDPPLVLYAIGNIQLLTRPLISIVGTRIPTPYGRRSSYQIAYDLSKSGFVVVSGMARGIDSEAHLGALIGGQGTIAVLGCGIDVVYPSEHGSLYMKIKQEGLLLSEYPPGTRPNKGLFPERNRIISGLSKAVVVIEAAARSGSHITVNAALEQGRDVFAVPGPIFSPQSDGPHQLIKDGAKLITRAQDIIDEYAWLQFGGGSTQNFDLREEIGVNEIKLLDIIENKELTVEELCIETGASLQEMIQQLLTLELFGKIRRLSGNRYGKVVEQKSLTNRLSIINNRED